MLTNAISQIMPINCGWNKLPQIRLTRSHFSIFTMHQSNVKPFSFGFSCYAGGKASILVLDLNFNSVFHFFCKSLIGIFGYAESGTLNIMGANSAHNSSNNLSIRSCGFSALKPGFLKTGVGLHTFE